MQDVQVSESGDDAGEKREHVAGAAARAKLDQRKGEHDARAAERSDAAKAGSITDGPHDRRTQPAQPELVRVHDASAER